MNTHVYTRGAAVGVVVVLAAAAVPDSLNTHVYTRGAAGAQMAHTELRFSVSSLYGDHLASCTHLPAGLGPCTELNNFRRGSPPGCLNAQLHETIANTTATLTHLGIRGKLFYAQTKHAPFARFATWLHAPRRARTLGRAHSLTSRQQHLLF